MKKLTASLGAAGLTLSLGLLAGACSPQETDDRSAYDHWIETHPTSSDDRGLCREFDGELCDEDPYDLDDFFELDEHGVKTKKPSSRPMQTGFQPKPSAKPRTTRR